VTKRQPMISMVRRYRRRRSAFAASRVWPKWRPGQSTLDYVKEYHFSNQEHAPFGPKDIRFLKEQRDGN
jgi:hypothetical protein